MMYTDFDIQESFFNENHQPHLKEIFWKKSEDNNLYSLMIQGK